MIPYLFTNTATGDVIDKTILDDATGAKQYAKRIEREMRIRVTIWCKVGVTRT